MLPVLTVQLLHHLCCELPAPACYIYQDMKPATLQHLIADRSKVEKDLRTWHEEARWQLKRVHTWMYQVSNLLCSCVQRSVCQVQFLLAGDLASNIQTTCY